MEIPEADRVWLSVAETRAATHTETLTFTAQANPNTTYRYSTVSLKDDSGLVAQSILFAQKASGYKTVHVETAGTLENYISADEKEKLIGLKLTGKLNTFDYDFMRTMPALESVDLAQIDNTTIPASCFKESTVKMVILPLNLEAISDNAFSNSSIISIDIPSSVVSIGVGAFADCSDLTGILTLPNNLRIIGAAAFTYCKQLTGNLIIPNSVVSIGQRAFAACNGFNGFLSLGSGLTTVPLMCFERCSGFTGNLIIPDQITTIEKFAFLDCTGFSGNLVLGTELQSIGDNSLTQKGSMSGNYYPLNFSKVYCKNSTPPAGRLYSAGNPYEFLGVPINSKSNYESVSSWKDSFRIIQEVEF